MLLGCATLFATHFHELAAPPSFRLFALQEIGCATLFATHFHELTALQGDVGVKNLHVTTAIDEASGSLTMLYQVRNRGGQYVHSPCVNSSVTLSISARALQATRPVPVHEQSGSSTGAR